MIAAVIVAASPAARNADSNSTRTISVPGGAIELTVEERPKSISDAALESWIERSARAVAAYYGRFPVERLDLAIRAGGSSGVSGGRTQGWGKSPRIRLFVADDATEKDLSTDWQLVHEMVHLALPSLSGHAWLEEGIAVYVEPIARARAGLQSKDEIWRWMLSGAPRGLEAIRTHGLDGSSGWAATYWGGTVYCLFADVGIRERTKGRKSLDDALRGIQTAGGDVTETWPIERVLDAGDRATGVPVLRELYAKWKDGPIAVDLPDLFQRLGVSSAGGRDGKITYDDAAPLASVRKGIETGK